MPNTDPDILVQRFVDGDLSANEVQAALHRIADDEEARDLLQFELEMTQDLAASRAAAPPDTFADDTMAALEKAPAPAPSFSEQVQRWWTTVTTPVALEVRPLTTAMAALLLGVVAWIAWPPATPHGPQPASSPPMTSSTSVQEASKSSTQQGTVWIRFMYTNNTADSVAVAGDFSQWDLVPLSPRTVNGETVWTGLVPVSQGEHEYQFVINGERWVPDPLAPIKRGDGFGTKNAVLKI